MYCYLLWVQLIETDGLQHGSRSTRSGCVLYMFTLIVAASKDLTHATITIHHLGMKDMHVSHQHWHNFCLYHQETVTSTSTNWSKCLIWRVTWHWYFMFFLGIARVKVLPFCSYNDVTMTVLFQTFISYENSLITSHIQMIWSLVCKGKVWVFSQLCYFVWESCSFVTCKAAVLCLLFSAYFSVILYLCWLNRVAKWSSFVWNQLGHNSWNSVLLNKIKVMHVKYNVTAPVLC